MRRDGYAGKPVHIGYPFHGLVRNGTLTLPNGETKEIRFKFQNYIGGPFVPPSMPSMVQRNPFALGDTRPAAEQSDDLTINGREYYDYALCPVGSSSFFGGRNIAKIRTGLDFGDWGTRAWLYTDPEGKSYAINLVIAPPSGGDDIMHPRLYCGRYDPTLEEEEKTIYSAQFWQGDLPRYYTSGDTSMSIRCFSATEDGTKAVHSVYESTEFGGVPYRISDYSTVYDAGYLPFLLYSDERMGILLRAVITVEVSGTGTDDLGNGLTFNVTIEDHEPVQTQVTGTPVTHTRMVQTQEDASGNCSIQSETFSVEEFKWNNAEVLTKWVEPSGIEKELVGSVTVNRSYGQAGTLGDQTGTANCNEGGLEDKIITWSKVENHYDYGIEQELKIRTVGSELSDWENTYSDYIHVFGDVISADPNYCLCDSDPTAPIAPNIDGSKDAALQANFNAQLDIAQGKQPLVYHVNGGAVVFIPEAGEARVWSFGQQATIACDCSDYSKILNLVGLLQIAVDPGKSLITVELSNDDILYI